MQCLCCVNVCTCCGYCVCRERVTFEHKWHIPVCDLELEQNSNAEGHFCCADLLCLRTQEQCIQLLAGLAVTRILTPRCGIRCLPQNLLLAVEKWGISRFCYIYI